MKKRTKIVATIGPASDKKEILKKMVENGLNVARLNFSHNVQSYHLKVIKALRAISRELKKSVGIIVDLQGPRIRLGDLPESGVRISEGEAVVLTTGKTQNGKVPVTYARLHLDVKSGERIFIADGLFELQVEKISGRDIFCRVVHGGTLFSNKGINLPDSKLKISAISEKDKKDIFFAVKNRVDFVALSFVSDARDVKELKKMIKRYEADLGIKADHPIMVIVKIERQEAVRNFDQILEATDAVMVARGDLGIELPLEKVPVIQKEIISKCLSSAKPVIVATQMLESMINNPRPTRAEVSDVANAVIDHTDAVMLSGETANGKFPVEAVSIMSKIITATEKSSYDDAKFDFSIDQEDAISQIVRILSVQKEIKGILGATFSGRTGRLISRNRPEKPIFLACAHERVRGQLCLSWGIEPILIASVKDYLGIVSKAKMEIRQQRFLKNKDKLIVLAGLGNNENLKHTKVEIQEM